MKARLFVVFTLLVLALSIIPASATFAASPTSQANSNNAPTLAVPHEVSFVGNIQSLPNTPGWIGTWKVGGKTIHVTNATVLDQTDFRVRVGAKVLVEGLKQKDGSYNATSIDVLR